MHDGKIDGWVGGWIGGDDSLGGWADRWMDRQCMDGWVGEYMC